MDNYFGYSRTYGVANANPTTLERVARIVEQPVELKICSSLPPIVVIPIKNWDRASEQAVRFGLNFSDQIIAVNVCLEKDNPKLRELWAEKVVKPAASAYLAIPHLRDYIVSIS